MTQPQPILEGIGAAGEQLVSIRLEGGKLVRQAGSGQVRRLRLRTNDGELLLDLPVVDCAVSALTATADLARAQVQIRAFCKGPSELPAATLGAEIEIEISAGLPRLRRFAWTGAKTGPTLPGPLAALSGASWTWPAVFVGTGAPTRPGLVDVLGFAAPAVLSGPFGRRLALRPSPLATPQPALLLEIENTLPAPTATDRRLAPFAIDLPTKGWPTEGAQGTAVARLRQRQPAGSHEDWRVDVDLPAGVALELWNRAVAAPVVASLRTVRDESPVSFLPTLSATTSLSAAARLGYAVVDRGPASLRTADFAFAVEVRGGASVAVAPATLRLATASGAAPPPWRVAAELVGAPTLNGTPLRYAFDLVQLEPASPIDWQLTPVRPAADAPLQQLRAGAFTLGMPQASPDPGTAPMVGKLKAWLGPAADGAWVQARQAELELPLAAVRPGGQDAAPTAEDGPGWASARPIVLEREVANGGEARLSVVEHVGDGVSQQLALRLSRDRVDGPLAGPTSVVVLDSEPFLVAQVELAVDADDLLFGVTTELANWSNRSGDGWELANADSAFTLVLPPQAVGEAMHRRRSSSAALQDIRVGALVDYRFSPAARFRLRTGDFRQRFSEAPWNLRRLLGYPGQRLPGAPLLNARFELLYGLEGEISQGGLRLTEMGALLGALAGPRPEVPRWPATLLQQGLARESASRWLALRRAVRSRLAILEPWDPRRLDDFTASTETDPTLVLGAEQGLAFVLRETASLRLPVPPPAPPGFPSGPPPLLAGSYAWAFESPNILAAVFRDRHATAAELRAPQFSSLGGWGSLKASFDEGRTTIRAEVAMGRLASLNVERLGRIGIFWNRAKHVVVYARTVARSRQFQLEQDALAGLPVLRKVDEYVELIEPLKELGAGVHGAAGRGPIAGCAFPQGKPPRIRVNGAWGVDVADRGWKIPLWQREAVPADVYPRPDVRVLPAGAALGAVAPAILDPEKLHFFTETTAGSGSDTDHWPPVFDVDFTAAAWPSPVANAASGDTAGFGPRAGFNPGVPRGLSAFTLTLAAGGAAVDLVAGRQPEPVAAQLFNVTAMRGAFLPEAGAPPRFDPRAEVDELLDAARRAANDPAVDLGKLASDLATRLAVWAPDLATASPRQACAALERRARATLAAAGVSLPFDPARCVPLLQAEAALSSGIAEAEAAVQALDSLAAPARQLLRQRIDQGLSGLEAETGTLPGFDGVQVTRPIAELRARLATLQDAIEPTLSDALAWLDALEDWDGEAWQELRGRLAPVIRAPGEQWQTLEFALRELLRPWLGELPDAPSFLRRAARRALDEASLGFGELVVAGQLPALEEVRTLLEDLLVAGSSLLTLVDETLGEAEELAGTLKPTAFHAAAAAVHTDLLERIDRLDASQPLDAARSELLQALDAARTRLDPAAYRGELQQLAQRLADATSAPLVPPSLCAWIPSLDDLADLLAPGRWLDLDRLPRLDRPQLLATIERLAAALGRDLADLTTLLELPTPPVPANLLPDFNILRAFGEPPRLPDLGFSLPAIEYRFWDRLPLPDVRLTPLVLRASRALGGVDLSLPSVDLTSLDPFGIRLPVISLADRFVPPDLGAFDIGSVFRNFGGLDQSSFFKDIRLPSVATDAIRVTHGIDRESRQAWIQGEVDVLETRDLPAFDLGGIAVTMKHPHYRALARVTAEPGRPPRPTLAASLAASWELAIGGLVLVTLEDSTLHLDESGRMRFDVSPDRVRLREELAFVSRLLAAAGIGEEGPAITVDASGVSAVLDLPLPDVQAGSFGIANLHLRLLFGLGLTDGLFSLRAAVALGRPTAPFTLTIFVLGGAGYIDVAFKYTPATGAFNSKVALGLFASASLAIALGPIKGGVSAYFGVTATYEAETGRAGQLQLAIVLLFTGQVSLLGLVTVNLALGLQARYESTSGRLVGRGFVSYSIKIGWFLRIEVSSTVEYQLGAVGGSQSTRLKTASFALPAGAADPPFDYRLAAARFHAQFAE
jgi:hypothetical protein